MPATSTEEAKGVETLWSEGYWLHSLVHVSAAMAKDDGITNEDEYFHRLEQENISRLKAEQDAEAAVADAAERRDTHFHKCGKCGGDMDTQLFKGIEIERCPSCGAVLLDPGELEELAGKDESGGLFSALLGLNKS